MFILLFNEFIWLLIGVFAMFLVVGVVLLDRGGVLAGVFKILLLFVDTGLV